MATCRPTMRKTGDKVMSRLKELRKFVDKKLAKWIDDDVDRAKAEAHLCGVSFAAAVIAQRRGMSPQQIELLQIAGMLHDVYAYKTGSYEDHAHKGAELAGQILDELKLTSPEENSLIQSAIYHHDDKAAVDSPADEVLKDADAMHHIYNDLSKPVKDKEAARYTALKKEFGIE